MKGLYNRHILDNLVKSGQLEVVAKGVYGKPPVELTWESVICSLQTKFEIDVIVGGLTALDLQGYGHYMSFMRPIQIELYASQAPPKWLDDLIDGVSFIFYSHQMLLGRRNNAVKSADLMQHTIMRQWRENRPSLIVASTELALLQVLAQVPNTVTVDHANLLMQSMTSLSPERLQQLLEQCQNVKVRRLFFFLADRHNWPWVKKLNRAAISLGIGNRVIEKGGRLDKQYMITVPRDL
jgi:hypothetical protein